MTSARTAWIAAALAFGVAAGAIVTHLLQRSSPTPLARGANPQASPGRDAPRLATELGALGERLEAESRARAALAEEVALLRAEVLRLGGLPEPDEEVWPEDEPATPERAGEPGVEEPGVPLADEEETAPAFDEIELLATGLHPQEVARLRERWDRHQMERIELTHQAAQEGWLFKPRHRREMQKLDRDLREDLGDSGYDRMLFATGQDNRVVVRDVVDRSPAFRAGFERGDVILSFDGQRVFKPGEVLLATTAESRGTYARVELLRDERVITLDVRRGPLGLMLEADHGTPAPD